MRTRAGSERILLELVAAIYDAALDPQLWRVFLDRYAEAVRGEYTLLIAHDFSRRTASIIHAARFDPALLKEYEEHYAAVNAWVICGQAPRWSGQPAAGAALAAMVIEGARVVRLRDMLTAWDAHGRRRGCRTRHCAQSTTSSTWTSTIRMPCGGSGACCPWSRCLRRPRSPISGAATASCWSSSRRASASTWGWTSRRRSFAKPSGGGRRAAS